MYPANLYPGYSWSMTQHMGIVNEKFLYDFLNAAVILRDVDDPPQRINEYLIANKVLPANVRRDTGQPDIWRDYQQILAELGLMYPNKYRRRITPTPIGVAFLDKELTFSDLMTLQTFRYQYPNGYKSVISDDLHNSLSGTPFSQYKTLTELQWGIGVCIRPAVLIWRVLHLLKEKIEAAYLTKDEIRRYLMRCIVHEDTGKCAEALVDARNGKESLDPIGRQRNAEEWIHSLVATPYFIEVREGVVGLSSLSIEREREFDEILANLERSSTFWQPKSFDSADLLSWHDYFGALDLGTPLIPLLSGELPDSEKESVEELKNLDDLRLIGRPEGSINLREYGFTISPSRRRTSIPEKLTIDISYDAELLASADRTHESMVRLIAETCRRKGARVMEDPSSVDLLVEYQQNEFIVEVKSVTPQNFIEQLRYAIGQVSHYGYLRSQQSALPCRKVIALAAASPGDWCVSFLNEYLGFDLLSLSGRELIVNTLNELTSRLFSS